jgi:DNA (cytosine-5)-methyltransferase 1
VIDGLVVDLFAGGGGASAGIEAALGRPVDIAINHDPIALAVHKANHPTTHHVEEDIWKANPGELVAGRRVALLWASPDCTHFSTAKGGKPRKKKLRTLAWAVYRWARATQPAVIFLENVKEFEGWGPLTKEDKPDKRFIGKTFRCWIRRIERLGYTVEHRMLDASLYGAPTRRRRLFIVARRDGQPIVWPEFTHGSGRLPLRTAAECIDWSLACPSIFERKRPLAEKTQWRIAQGVKRFVLEAPRPFIVGVGGRAGQSAPTGADEPLGTVTAKNDRAVVAPTLIEMNHSNAPRAVDAPLGVVTSQANRFNLVAPHLIKVNHGKLEARGRSLELPLTTVTADCRGGDALIVPALVRTAHGDEGKNGSKRRGAPIHPLEEPLPTVTASKDFALMAPTLVQMGYGEREGQLARVPGLGQPLGTVVAQGQKHGLVSAFLAKHFGGVIGHELQREIGTITARDHHALTAAHLVKLRGECHSAGMDEPVPTITAGGHHYAEVCAFLLKYYGTARAGQSLEEPLHTLEQKHRFGLVTVEGVDYQIVDIGMRMLEPHELLRAQCGRFAAGFDLSKAIGKKGKWSKTAAVKLIGNMVCPEAAYALVVANTPRQAERAAA